MAPGRGGTRKRRVRPPKARIRERREERYCGTLRASEVNAMPVCAFGGSPFSGRARKSWMCGAHHRGGGEVVLALESAG